MLFSKRYPKAEMLLGVFDTDALYDYEEQRLPLHAPFGLILELSTGGSKAHLFQSVLFLPDGTLTPMLKYVSLRMPGRHLEGEDKQQALHIAKLGLGIIYRLTELISSVMILKIYFYEEVGMAVHNFISTVMSSRSSAFSPKRTDFFAKHNDSIVGNIQSVPPYWHLAGLFPFTRFFPIPINSHQKAAYLARFV